MPTLYTIGHSQRTSTQLLEMLQQAGLQLLVDVRAHPRSARQPRFNSATLRQALGSAGLEYHWLGTELGGFRSERPDSRHTALRAGLRAFADYMETEAFAQGIAQLLALAVQTPSAIMCAEKLPSQCHRSLIADYLMLHDLSVVHLIEAEQRETHTLHAGLRNENGRLVYDRSARSQRELKLE